MDIFGSNSEFVDLFARIEVSKKNRLICIGYFIIKYIVSLHNYVGKLKRA